MNSWEELLERCRTDPDEDSPIEPARLEELARLEEEIGYSFQRPALLERALTHRSYANLSSGGEKDYESLEFLGDAVLDFVISDLLFRMFPDRPEGALSKARSHLVSRKQLARLSAALGLDRYVRLSSGEERTGGRQKKALLGDLWESLLAALYLDGGIEPVRRFVLERFEPLLTETGRKDYPLRDHKSRLQEALHARGVSEPEYRIVREQGPDHRKEFLIEARIAGKAVARAWGRTKKEAEQKAAQDAFGLVNEQS